MSSPLKIRDLNISPRYNTPVGSKCTSRMSSPLRRVANRNNESPERNMISRSLQPSPDPLTKPEKPNIPTLLSLYLQLIINLIVVCFILYLVWKFISVVQADVSQKILVHSSKLSQEILTCTREYKRNHCSPDIRVPALELSCSQWESCMNRDMSEIGISKVAAETLAEMINAFVKPISLKSMIFIFLLIFGTLFLTNAAFGSYRVYSQVDFRNQIPPQSANSLISYDSELES